MIKEITSQCKWYEDVAIFLDIDKALVRIDSGNPDGCGPDKWMSLPSMGECMDNAFQTPVFFFSSSWSQTFLPYFCPPNKNPPIFLALIPSAFHFVALKLKSPTIFPAPQISKDWDQKASPEAFTWKARYANCFQMTSGRNILHPTNTY